MNKEDAKKYFLGLPPKERGLFLALLSHNLTVTARGYYEAAGGPASAATRQAAFERLNELQHHLSAHFRKLLGDPEAGFPDDAIIDVLYAGAEPFVVIKGGFLRAFERSAQHYGAGIREDQASRA